MQIGQFRPFGQPDVGHRGRAQGQRSQRIARGRGRRRVGPGLDLAARHLELAQQVAEPVLRMILRNLFLILAQIGPDRLRHVETETGEHKRALWQLCHRLHQQGRGAPRSGRACDNHRMLRRVLLPLCDQALCDLTLPRTRIGAGDAFPQILMRDGEELFRAFPMARLVANIQLGHGLDRYAFALHFVDQLRQTVRQVIKRRARSQFRRLIQQL